MRFIMLAITFCSLASCGLFQTNDCSKNITARFWTKNAKDTLNTLFIDGIAKGRFVLNDSSGTKLTEVSLVCGRYNLSVKTPAGKQVCDGTLVVEASSGHTEINTSWTCPDYEVQVIIDPEQ